MTSKDRVIAAITHTEPDRVPIDFRFAPELMRRLAEYFQVGDDRVLEQFGQDVVTVRPVFTKAATPIKYADPTIEIDERGYYLDIYRVPFRLIETEAQKYLEPVNDPPLREYEDIESLDSFPWPTTEWWDYSGIEAKLDANAGKARWCRSRGCFATAQLMRGMDVFLIDLMLNPSYAVNILERIMRFVTEDAENSLKAGNGKYTFIEYNDDVAYQKSMMLSPEMWRRYIKPLFRDFCDMAHKHGAFVKYHSCGSIYPIIPDLIEIGVDILNPLQPLAVDMDPLKLKKEFGDRLCLHGGLDIQYLLPRGSENEVKTRVKELIDTVGCNGGYILSGSHTIQADAKTENMIAVLEAIRERAQTPLH